MQTRTYMVVDPRHDHTFRVPRPDLSLTLGTPNACNDCHRDKPAQWAASAVEQWFGPNRRGYQTFGAAFQAARTDQADAAALLGIIAADKNAPVVARASALSELGPWVSPANVNFARSGLSDPDPMVRIGALDMLTNVPAPQIWPLVSPLLADPVRGVRIRAVALLANVPVARQPQGDRTHFDQAAADFVAAQLANAERPEARTTLANFLAQRGQSAEAEAEYKAALRLSPLYTTAAINLVDLYRQLGRDKDGEAVLRSAIVVAPRDAAVHYALGLTLTRLKRTDEALAAFQRATELEPASSQYAYVHAVALHSSGRAGEAVAVLTEALKSHPNDRSILSALVAFNRTDGNAAAALTYAQRLAAITPGDPNLTKLIDELREAAKPPAR
ncbi:tetratricopeptide repeat protein [Bradyrhizobium sp. JR3.5]